ncbi:MAG: 4Fe-4S binding protein [Thermoplasmata archaeon]|nr:MAG: 4Fe-4S binding protein [Thermoplasmata archaeon]
MAMNRRSFVKMLGVAGASLLVSLGLQSSGVNRVKAEKSLIPGAGGLEKEEYQKIDSDSFIGLCSRCGVCINACPFKAIKSKEIFYPSLTRATREKCPGYETCGVCLANCPTDALGLAYEPLGGTPGTEKSQLWNGPTLRHERDIIGQNR